MKKNNLNKQIYYQCPYCENIITLTELLEQVSSGGLPYCYCEYDSSKTMVRYKIITKKEYLKIKEKK